MVYLCGCHWLPHSLEWRLKNLASVRIGGNEPVLEAGSMDLSQGSRTLAEGDQRLDSVTWKYESC